MTTSRRLDWDLRPGGPAQDHLQPPTWRGRVKGRVCGGRGVVAMQAALFLHLLISLVWAQESSWNFTAFQKRVNLFPSNCFNRCEKVSSLCEKHRKMPPSSSWENMKADLYSISPMWIALKRMMPLSKHWLYLINATFTVSWRILKLNQVLNRVRSHLIGGTWRRLWNTTGSGGESVAKYESNHVIPFHFLALSGSKELSPPREMLQRRPCHVLLPWVGGKIVARDPAVARM